MIRYRMMIEATKPPAESAMLKKLLKHLLRMYQFRCIGLEEVKDHSSDEDSKDSK